MEALFLNARTIACAAVLFVSIILILATPPKYTKKALGLLAVIAVTAALGLYGYGYQQKYPNDFASNILRTVFDSCRTLLGTNNWSEVKDVYSYSPFWVFFFWLVHLMAMVSSASAVIVSLGSRLLKKIRIRIFRRRDISLIYGLSENTLEFGRNLAAQAKAAVLFVDQGVQNPFQAAVDQMGALLRTDSDALAGNERFVKSIGLNPGKRKLHVYALNRSMISNQQFAKHLLASLEQKGILTEQTSLTILDTGEEVDNPLQAIPGRYGYGSVLSVNEPEMVARLLVRNYPPCHALTFDGCGRGTADFHGLVIGFGRTGQAVLRHLVMNSQFQGSRCRIAVFSPDYEQRMGWLAHECRSMLEHYNITMYPYDGRSSQLYDYLEENIDTLNYITICAGDESANLEIAEQLQSFLLRHNNHAPVLMCSRSGVFHQSAEEFITAHRIYTPELLCSDEIDRMAMILNQSYIGTGDMRENWKRCAYFDRMSCRAAADFHGALLCSAGLTAEDVDAQWEPSGELLESLSASEHLRWVAFHYCMGFRPMPEEVYQSRVAAYRKEKALNPGTKYRITKDMENRFHACMIPWEELDDYSARENAVTGENRDYAEYDRNNIRDLAKLLQIGRETV